MQFQLERLLRETVGSQNQKAGVPPAEVRQRSDGSFERVIRIDPVGSSDKPAATQHQRGLTSPARDSPPVVNAPAAAAVGLSGQQQQAQLQAQQQDSTQALMGTEGDAFVRPHATAIANSSSASRPSKRLRRKPLVPSSPAAAAAAVEGLAVDSTASISSQTVQAIRTLKQRGL